MTPYVTRLLNGLVITPETQKTIETDTTEYTLQGGWEVKLIPGLPGDRDLQQAQTRSSRRRSIPDS